MLKTLIIPRQKHGRNSLYLKGYFFHTLILFLSAYAIYWLPFEAYHHLSSNTSSKSMKNSIVFADPFPKMDLSVKTGGRALVRAILPLLLSASLQSFLTLQVSALENVP